MSTLPVYSPRVPFLGQIPGGFRPSLMIRMRAKLTTRTGRCMINLIKNPALNSNQDIMLHISIRLDQHCMVRNTFQNGNWQEEERNGTFKITYNDPFEIAILAEFDHYKIAVNGVHIAEFAHRLPLHLVQYMNVKGDVVVEHILLEQDIKTSSVAIPVNQYGIGATSVAAPAFPQYAIGTTATQIPSAPTVHITYQQPPPNQPYNPSWGHPRY